VTLLGEIAHPYSIARSDGRVWTVADYLQLPTDGRRYELIEGTLFMNPSPHQPHQECLGEIHLWLRLRLDDRRPSCKVFIAPFDVYLRDDIIVQPDLLVLLPEHLNRLAKDGVHGAPSVVIEIASPGTATYDRHDKLLAYAKAAVGEYWLVDPIAKTLEILVLRGGRYHTHALLDGPADVPSPALGMLAGPVSRFFV